MDLKRASTRRYSSGDRSWRKAKSTCPSMAVRGERNWCEASPVNRFCRSRDSPSLSSRALNDRPSSSSSSSVPGVGNRRSGSSPLIACAASAMSVKGRSAIRQRALPVPRASVQMAMEPVPRASTPGCGGLRGFLPLTPQRHLVRARCGLAFSSGRAMRVRLLLRRADPGDRADASWPATEVRPPRR